MKTVIVGAVASLIVVFSVLYSDPIALRAYTKGTCAAIVAAIVLSSVLLNYLVLGADSVMPAVLASVIYPVLAALVLNASAVTRIKKAADGIVLTGNASQAVDELGKMYSRTGERLRGNETALCAYYAFALCENDDAQAALKLLDRLDGLKCSADIKCFAEFTRLRIAAETGDPAIVARQAAWLTGLSEGTHKNKRAQRYIALAQLWLRVYNGDARGAENECLELFPESRFYCEKLMKIKKDD